MQIQLCEDDGLFHGGVPQIVILVVQFDDGKTKRIPYPADKSISSLYQDLQAIAPQVDDQKVDLSPILQEKMDIATKTVADTFVSAYGNPSPNKLPSVPVDKSNIIEKEDIVTMVKMNPRDDVYNGTVSPLMVGMNYRVIKVIGPKIPTPDGKGIKQIIQGFEVIDDTAPTPERMIVTPDEVVLHCKRLSPIIEKISKMEEIRPCPSCQVNNCLVLDGSDFKGKCEACGVDILISRIIKDCGTIGCMKDKIKVSCFDTGGKYEGVCGKCHSSIEVLHA